MQRTRSKIGPVPGRIRTWIPLAALALGLSAIAQAQSIPNPSFEAESFPVFPGYISENVPLTGWTTDFPSFTGLNPAGGDNAFANNGAVPNGNNVAFLFGGSALNTTITGLTAGKTYTVTVRVNASTGQVPNLRAVVDSSDILALSVYPVGGSAPYMYVAFNFTATGATASLALANDAAGDQTLLVDALTIAESTGRWTVDAWTDDATSGVDSQYVYSHAYNFGSANSTLINGVPFTGVAGINPAVPGKFTAARFGNVFNGDANNITGGSRTLANDFVYSGATVPSGEYQSITLEGLTPGTEYVATLYTVAWENPFLGARWATFSVGEDRLTWNQDVYQNDNGLRLSYRYTAGQDGKAVINIAPINPANVSIHIYGFSNREAVSRNVAPSIVASPENLIVAAGLPVDLTVSAGGFPAPTYQWRFNGENINGATSSTYTIANVTSAQAGQYDVVVSNSQGTATSDPATLVVGIPLSNASFETDSFLSWPGYSGDNPGNPSTPAGFNIPITDWVQDNQDRSGINPISNGESPFADNGRIPHGRQVAFLQSTDGPVTLSRLVSGMTAGSQYYLHYYENARSATATPALAVQLGDVVTIPEHPVPSGQYVGVYSDVFTAPSDALQLTFTKSSPNGGDTTALVDCVAIVPVPAGTAPFITRNPVSTAAYVGGSATFSAQVLGSLPLSYQWLRNGEPVSGATAPVLVLSDLQASAAGEYTLRASNTAGTNTTTVARLTINERIASLYNTGVDNTYVSLPDGETDGHYELIVNPHIESTTAIVQDSTTFPIVAGPWLANTETSKWIGPEFNTVAGAVGLYTYRTRFDLTGRDPRSVFIRGQWASDNAGRDILLNGVSTGSAQSPGFGSYTPFTLSGMNLTFVAGPNTLDFIVENEAAIGYTGLRVEFVESNSLPASSTATLQIRLIGETVTVTWTGGSATQKLQSAPTLSGPWTDVTGATSPYTTTAGSTPLFYRVGP
jgi:hypothetical protein